MEQRKQEQEKQSQGYISLIWDEIKKIWSQYKKQIIGGVALALGFYYAKFRIYDKTASISEVMRMMD